MQQYLEPILNIIRNETTNVYKIYQEIHKIAVYNILDNNLIDCLKWLDSMEIYSNGTSHRLNTRWLIDYVSNKSDYYTVDVVYPKSIDCNKDIAQQLVKLNNSSTPFISYDQHMQLLADPDIVYLYFYKDGIMIGYMLASIVSVSNARCLHIWNIVRVPELPYIELTSIAYLHISTSADIKNIDILTMYLENCDKYIYNLAKSHRFNATNLVNYYTREMYYISLKPNIILSDGLLVEIGKKVYSQVPKPPSSSNWHILSSVFSTIVEKCVNTLSNINLCKYTNIY